MSDLAPPIVALSGPTATAGANGLTFVVTGIALCKWYNHSWSATGRLNAIRGGLKEVEELYQRLDTQAQALTLTAREEASIKIQATTLGVLRNKYHAALAAIQNVGSLQRYWQWGNIMVDVKELDREIRLLTKDIANTTHELDKKGPGNIFPSGSSPIDGPFPPRGGFVNLRNDSSAISSTLEGILSAPFSSFSPVVPSSDLPQIIRKPSQAYLC